MFHFLFVTLPLAIVLYVVGAIYLLQYLEQKKLLARDKRIPLPRVKPAPTPEPAPTPKPSADSEPAQAEVEEEKPVLAPVVVPEPEVRALSPQRDPWELGPHVPEDPILRRHFGVHVMGMIQELQNMPVPEEAVLRRHFQQGVEETFNACLHDELAYSRLVYEYEQTFMK